MDKEFEEAIQQSNYRAIFENQKEKLKEVLEGKLIFPYNGGFFKIDPSLFSELLIYLSENKNQQLILDMHLNPIRISDVDSFYKTIRSRYTESINKYSIELAKLKKSRYIPLVVQLDLEDDTEE